MKTGELCERSNVWWHLNLNVADVVETIEETHIWHNNQFLLRVQAQFTIWIYAV